MNEVWNLDRIYAGFADPAFEADMAALKDASAECAAFAAGLADAEPLEGLRKGIALREKVESLAGKLAEYCMLRSSANSRDAEAGSNMGRVMGLISSFAGPFAAFEDWAPKLPDLMDLVRGDEQLKAYEFLFANMADSSRYLLGGNGEEIMAKMELSGGSAWSDLQTHVSGFGTSSPRKSRFTVVGETFDACESIVCVSLRSRLIRRSTSAAFADAEGVRSRYSAASSSILARIHGSVSRSFGFFSRAAAASSGSYGARYRSTFFTSLIPYTRRSSRHRRRKSR